MAKAGDKVWAVYSGPDMVEIFAEEERAEERAEGERQWMRDHDLERYTHQIEVHWMELH